MPASSTVHHSTVDLKTAVKRGARGKAESLTSAVSLQYLREHELPLHLNIVLQKVLDQKPDDPIGFMERELRDIGLARERMRTSAGESNDTSPVVTGVEPKGVSPAPGKKKSNDTHHVPLKNAASTPADVATDRNVSARSSDVPPQVPLSGESAAVVQPASDQIEAKPPHPDDNKMTVDVADDNSSTLVLGQHTSASDVKREEHAEGTANAATTDSHPSAVNTTGADAETGSHAEDTLMQEEAERTGAIRAIDDSGNTSFAVKPTNEDLAVAEAPHDVQLPQPEEPTVQGSTSAATEEISGTVPTVEAGNEPAEEAAPEPPVDNEEGLA